MKIAYLCNLYPAPTHTFIRREIRAVMENGIDVERISIRRFIGVLPSSWDREEFDRTFCVLDRNPFSIVLDVLQVAVSRPYIALRTIWRLLRLAFRSEAGILKHLAYFAEACVVFRYARQQHVEHIHTHFGTNAATVAMLVRWFGGPSFSCTIHGPGEWDCPEFLHIPLKVKEAAFISVISDFAKSQTYRWSASDYWSKVHVIRCGVDEAFLSRPTSPVPDVKNLIMIGRLGRSKGHVVLLEALQRLATQGIDCRVKLIGDGPMRDFIEREVRARELQTRVELVGWVDSDCIRKELETSRALVLPSFGEGLPVVIMECLALARPVICTRIAGISELVTHGKNGWLVNSGSVEQLTEAISEVLATPTEVLSRIGAAGREVVLRNHDASVEGRKLSVLFRQYGAAG